MGIRLHHCAAVFSLLLAGQVHAQLVESSDAELSGVSGQEGIAIELELRLNADTNGNRLAFCGTAPTQCRLGLNFANRNDGGGEWLVLKDVYGVMKIPTLDLTGTRTPAASTIYRDLTRFRDENGVQLFADPNNIPALQLQYRQPMQLLWNIGGISAEYGATGYENASAQSFMGVRIGNQSGQMADINIQGKALLFGF